MKILILEDDPERVRHFKGLMMAHDVRVCSEAQECIELLQKEAWDWAFLDHDLGGQVHVPSGPGTGYEVASWLGEHLDHHPVHGLVIHSVNGVGAQRMKDALHVPVWHVPFIWLVKQEELDDFFKEYSNGGSVRGRSGCHAVRTSWLSP